MTPVQQIYIEINKKNSINFNNQPQKKKKKKTLRQDQTFDSEK
jgi:hypothetical protein